MRLLSFIPIIFLIVGSGCTPTPILPENPIDPGPTDTVPEPINPLYDYELLWTLPMLPDSGYSSNWFFPVVHKGNLLFAAQKNWWEPDQEDQHLVYIDPDTRETIWRWDDFNSTHGNRSFIRVKIFDDVLYGTDGPRIFAVDLQTGQTNWVIDASRVELSLSNGFLFYAINNWTKEKPADLYQYNPADNTHELVYHIDGKKDWYNFLKVCTSTYNVEGDEILYFLQTGYRNEPFRDTTILYCYNNDRDELLWQFGTSDQTFSSKPAIVDGDRVYFGTVHDMYCLDRQTGELIWRERSTHTNYSSLYRLFGDKIIRISNEGDFKAIDKTTGAVLYEHDYGVGYTDDMSYLDGRVYYADGGQLNIVDVETGERLYRWKTKNKIGSDVNFISRVALDPERGVLYVSDGVYINCIRIPE